VPGLSSSDTSGLVFLALVVLILVRRTYRLAQGAPYSPVRVFAYGGFSAVLLVFFAASTIYVAVAEWGVAAYALLVPYVGVVVGSALIAEPRIRRLVKFDELAGGQTYYRLPLVVPVLTLVLFVFRASVEIGLFGFSALASLTFPTSLSPGALEILIAFDLLYGASIGLLVGRGLAVRAAFHARTLATNPLPEA
jgi:hypothetical protein